MRAGAVIRSNTVFRSYNSYLITIQNVREWSKYIKNILMYEYGLSAIQLTEVKSLQNIQKSYTSFFPARAIEKVAHFMIKSRTTFFMKK